jgi:hypothetical protein
MVPAFCRTRTTPITETLSSDRGLAFASVWFLLDVLESELAITGTGANLMQMEQERAATRANAGILYNVKNDGL